MVFYRNTYNTDHLFSSSFSVTEQIVLSENILQLLKKTYSGVTLQTDTANQNIHQVLNNKY
jgi:hypothetical protein